MARFGFNRKRSTNVAIPAGGGGGGGGTVWATNADYTLTNTNLTAERTALNTFWGLEHASTAKTNGTVIFTIDAIGSATVYVGFDVGMESANLGADSTGASWGWQSTGHFVYSGGTAWDSFKPVPTYTTGDVLKVIKTGGTYALYKNGTLVQTVDTTDAGFGASSPPTGTAYPSICSQHNTGLKVTADFTGW
jgi:hypothetical protein